MNKFIRHLKKNNMTYSEHLKNALCYSIESGKVSIIFAIHAFIPFIFEHAGSDKLTNLTYKINKHRAENI